MKAWTAQTTQFAMEYRRITEAYDPLRMAKKMAEVEFVNDADASITSSGKPNGIDVIVIHVFLHDSRTKLIATRKDMVDGIQPVVINGNETMLFKPIDGKQHLVRLDLSRRGYNSYF